MAYSMDLRMKRKHIGQEEGKPYFFCFEIITLHFYALLHHCTTSRVEKGCMQAT